MFPLWLKIGYTAFVGLIVVVYWIEYGPGNFLWFSDLALVLLVPALWLESSLLASMVAISITLLEAAWNIDYFGRLITGHGLFGLSKYMFDRRITLWVRALSLFHVCLAPLALWIVYRLGYDGRALLVQTIFAWLVLPLSYWLTKPSENVNWVRGLRGNSQNWMPATVYLIFLMLAIPLLFYVPTHLLLKHLFA